MSQQIMAWWRPRPVDWSDSARRIVVLLEGLRDVDPKIFGYWNRHGSKIRPYPSMPPKAEEIEKILLRKIDKYIPEAMGSGFSTTNHDLAHFVDLSINIGGQSLSTGVNIFSIKATSYKKDNDRKFEFSQDVTDGIIRVLVEDFEVDYVEAFNHGDHVLPNGKEVYMSAREDNVFFVHDDLVDRVEKPERFETVRMKTGILFKMKNDGRPIDERFSEFIIARETFDATKWLKVPRK